MGQAMARNLLAAGFTVRAWNRTADKARPLVQHGAQLCGSPAEAATGADIVLTMLSDTEAVLAAMDGQDGALTATGEGVVWIQASTIGIDGTERCAVLAARHGVALVDAPVLGTKAPAQSGELIVMAAGPQAVRARVDPVFAAVAKRTLWLADVGEPTRLKLAVNAWVLTLVEGTAETLALAEGLGLDPRLILDLVAGGPLDSPYLQTKGKAILDRDFAPSFRLALAAKDAALVQDAAARHGLDLPMLAAIRDRLAQGAREHGDEDMIATWRTSAPRPAS
ncbi:MAG: 3-hydroxyisobutyrate dehydrogenase [Solirubrobacterales bacterium]|nr:3-hydroxyisobutyrate dehydrogenase [Solirubrobacterales bacterium]